MSNVGPEYEGGCCPALLVKSANGMAKAGLHLESSQNRGIKMPISRRVESFKNIAEFIRVDPEA